MDDKFFKSAMGYNNTPVPQNKIDASKVDLPVDDAPDYAAIADKKSNIKITNEKAKYLNATGDEQDDKKKKMSKALKISLVVLGVAVVAYVSWHIYNYVHLRKMESGGGIGQPAQPPVAVVTPPAPPPIPAAPVAAPELGVEPAV